MPIVTNIPPAPAPEPPSSTDTLPRDVTAILLPAGLRTNEEIFALCEKRPSPTGAPPAQAAWLVRIAPLPALSLVQVEVLDGKRGYPAEDPELVEQMSAGGQATFVHVNHSASQALVHRFIDKKAEAGWAGSPGPELDALLQKAIGASIVAVTGADDGTRLGIGLSSSHTTLLARGRRLAFPRGLPTALDSFAFHDRGHGERVALVAFDDDERRRLEALPDAELATALRAVPLWQLGPLARRRDEVVAALDDQKRDAPVLAEITALAAAHAFSAGEETSYLDQDPPAALGAGRSGSRSFPPRIWRTSKRRASSTCALVEILLPPGAAGRRRIAPGRDRRHRDCAAGAVGERRAERVAVSFARRAATRSGASLRRTAPGRAARSLRARLVSGRRVRGSRGGRVRSISPRQSRGEPHGTEIDRYVVGVAELRTVLELADRNQLATALLFYEAA